MTAYDSGSYRNNTFKMSLTEAVRAHLNHDLRQAKQHYRAAISGANNGHAYLGLTLAFLHSQAESRAGWQFSTVIKNAEKSGFEQELADISRIIEDPSVREAYNSYIEAAQQGTRPVTRRIARGTYVDPTPTGRTQRPV